MGNFDVFLDQLPSEAEMNCACTRGSWSKKTSKLPILQLENRILGGSSTPPFTHFRGQGRTSRAQTAENR
jgi:hypothetical protein